MDTHHPSDPAGEYTDTLTPHTAVPLRPAWAESGAGGEPPRLTRALRHLFRFLASTIYRVQIRGNHHLGDTPSAVVTSYASPREVLFVALFLEGRVAYVVPANAPRTWGFRLLAWLFPTVRADLDYRHAPRNVRRRIQAGFHVVFFQRRDPAVSGIPGAECEGPARVLARTEAPLVRVLVHRPGLTYAAHSLEGLPRSVRKPVLIDVYPPQRLELPQAGGYPQRVASATDGVRQALLETLVDSRVHTCLFAAFLGAARVFGWNHRILKDARGADDTYRTLLKKIGAVARIASRLSATRETIGVMLPTSVGCAAVVLGLIASGRVPAMINFTAGREGVRRQFDVAGLKTVLTSRVFIEEGGFRGLVPAFPQDSVVYLEDWREKLGPLDKLWILRFLLFPRGSCPPYTASDPGLVLFTSGSEGRPKGVVHSHDSILANVAQLRAVSHFSAQDQFIMALPFFHSFGFTLGLAMPLVSGAPVYLYPTPLHYRRIAELVRDERATVLFGTPTFLAKYAAQAEPGDFDTLKLVISGGERLPETVVTLWKERFGIDLLDGYGATETAPVISVNTPENRRAGSVGRLLPGMRAELEKRPGFEQAGLLKVSGPNCMLGYLDGAESGGNGRFPDTATAPIWHSTGDIVSIDADGYLYVRGRARRFAKVAGEMVSLETSEQIGHLASPDAAHAAAIRPDPVRGEAIVLVTTDPALNRERLAAAAHQAGIAEIAIPRRIIVVDTIPLLGNGKTDYGAVERQLAQA
jgi:acyl-[acyl-carrier-protein]-phospholipid O-acyltransferase/long-chain-fatty-acid--[acyl-carrier-protein] ligase